MRNESYLTDKIDRSIEAHEFMESPLGKHLARRAVEEEQQALRELSDCDPTDSKAVQKLQNNARIARLAIQWIMETIDEGTLAYDALESGKLADAEALESGLEAWNENFNEPTID